MIISQKALTIFIMQAESRAVGLGFINLPLYVRSVFRSMQRKWLNWQQQECGQRMLSMIPMMQPHILKTEPLAALVGIFQQLMPEKNWKRRAWRQLWWHDVSPDIHVARSRYNGDMIAVATNSKNPERAALVLDYMKSDVDLNRTLLGGIQGEHWDLNEEGQRMVLDAAENYSWNSWAWALNRADEPVMAGTDERELAISDSINSRELFAEVAGFTFDSSSIATELSARIPLLMSMSTASLLEFMGQ